MMDVLREYFCNTYGITKIPLLREQEAPMDEPEGHWEDPMMQMINRAPHRIPAAGGGGGGGGGGGVGAVCHPSYVVDNKMVFDKLAEICHTHSRWTYIKPFLRRCDGRSAFLALVNHFLIQTTLIIWRPRQNRS